jgi:hypothetical protein
MDAVANETRKSQVESDSATFTKWLVGEGPGMASGSGSG